MVRLLKSTTLLLLGILAVLPEVACTSGSSPTKEALEARLKSYWELRQKGDWGAIYEYLTPEERKFVKRNDFVNDRSKQLSFLSFQIESVEVRDKEGITNTKCKWRITLPGDQIPHRDGDVNLTEYWLYAGDNWYLKMFNPNK